MSAQGATITTTDMQTETSTCRVFRLVQGTLGCRRRGRTHRRLSTARRLRCPSELQVDHREGRDLDLRQGRLFLEPHRHSLSTNGLLSSHNRHHHRPQPNHLHHRVPRRWFLDRPCNVHSRRRYPTVQEYSRVASYILLFCDCTFVLLGYCYCCILLLSSSHPR